MGKQHKKNKVRGGTAPVITKSRKSGKGNKNMNTKTVTLTADEQKILNSYRKLDREKKEAAAYHCNYLLKHKPKEEFNFQSTIDSFLREMGYIE